MKKKVAILGATGYIGRSLAWAFRNDRNIELFLFARSRAKLKKTARRVGARGAHLGTIASFSKGEYDAVINCTGIANPSVLKKNPKAIFKTTEAMDSLVMHYLQAHSQTKYINMSSGIVGTVSPRMLAARRISEKDYYAVAKAQAEARHRALKRFSIIDIRVFSFFSRLVDLHAGFLMSDIARALKTRQIFITAAHDLVRDYITPPDLADFIRSVLAKAPINRAFEIYSKKPVSKFALLKALQKRFQLRYRMQKNAGLASPTGKKDAYYPKKKNAKRLGYAPRFTSEQGIIEELKHLK